MATERKRSLVAILLALSVLFNLVFLIFAFLQKASADSARLEASANEQKAFQMQKLAQAERAAAEQAEKAAERALNDCQAQRALTEKKRR